MLVPSIFGQIAYLMISLMIFHSMYDDQARTDTEKKLYGHETPANLMKTDIQEYG